MGIPFFQQFFSDHTIASFMSVIPLVAGSLDAVVGGLIPDVLVKNRGSYVCICVLIASQVRDGVVLCRLCQTFCSIEFSCVAAYVTNNCVQFN